MGKLKPDWQKTDIPKHIKIVMWLVMKDNTTYRAWEKNIIIKDFPAEDLKYLRFSRDTYSSLKQEIKSMPLEEVETLPDSLQKWIFQLRPELLADKQRVTPQKGKTMICNYSRDDLSKGCTVYVHPAMTLEIPLVVENGEAITHIAVDVVKGGTENCIDIEVLDNTGKSIKQWGRHTDWAMGCCLVAGQYILRLGNDYQPNSDKRLRVQILWQAYTGTEPPPIEFADMRVDFM